MNSFEPESIDTEELEREVGTSSSTVTQEPKTAPAPKVEIVEETPAEPLPPSDHANVTFEMEAVPQISTELAYACLLIPRFNDHYLDVCVSYGWRLDAITIRPGYLQWIMTVPFTENPARFMKLLRQQTSQKIFEDYPRFKRKNVSLDFWAPGFSVVHGSSPQSPEEINSFILQIRRQQGLY